MNLFLFFFTNLIILKCKLHFENKGPLGAKSGKTFFWFGVFMRVVLTLKLNFIDSEISGQTQYLII